MQDRAFLDRLVGVWLPNFAAQYGASASVSLLWPLIALGLYDLVRRRRSLLLLVVWTGVFVLSYAWLHASGSWWYALPVLYLSSILAASGLGFLVARTQRWARAAGAIVAVLLLGFAIRHGVSAVFYGRGDPRAPCYLATARWLEANTPATSSVAFVEIGYLGYYTNRGVIDLLGLVEPAFDPHDSAANFWAANPDYVLYAPEFRWLMGRIVNDARFARRYRLIAQSPAPSPHRFVSTRARPSRSRRVRARTPR